MQIDKTSQYPTRRKRRVARPFGLSVFALATVLGVACGYQSNGDGTPVATTHQADSECNYSIATNVHGVGSKGFNVSVDVTNVSGATSTGFSVLVSAGGATLDHVANGSFTTSASGYLLTPNPSIASSQLNQGQTFHFELQFDGAYTVFNAFLTANNGSVCDPTPPTINMTTSGALTANGALFTSNSTLTLSATASDSVGLSEVVFSQDGVQVGQPLYAQPYTVSIPITNALNGPHTWTATAYDLAGNSASESVRGLVAIGDQFFGSETSTAADYTDFLPYFKQITPGNAGKWGSVEAVQGTFDWTDLDTAYQYAQAHGLRFKYHNLIWGSQQPAWLNSLSSADQYTAITEWFAAVAARYPNLDMIDVVNEPIHTPPQYIDALGGTGVTGYDWVINAYQLARQYFPNSQLLVNEYFTLAIPSLNQQYVSLINLLQSQGLIDGIGEQGHFYEKSPDLTTFQTNLDNLAATGLPIYISEFDLNLQSDALQAQRMSELFPIFWSNPSVVGVTVWGYLQGNTWEPYTYLVNDDFSLRPAFTWLECYLGGGTNCPLPTYVPSPHAGDAAGLTLSAVDYDAANDLIAAGNEVAYTNDGSWLAFDQVMYEASWNTLSVTYANGGSSSVNLAVSFGGLSSSTNPVVATVALPPTGSWNSSTTVSIPWAPIGSTQDTYFELQGGPANIQTIMFAAPPPPARNIIANGTFESGNTNGWFTYGGGTLSATTTRAHSGTYSAYVTNRAGNSPVATILTVNPGQDYPFSLWVSIQSPDGTPQHMQVTQGATCLGANGVSSTNYTILRNLSIPSGNQWTQLSGVAQVPNCTLTQYQFYVENGYQGAEANTDLYVDDVVVLDDSGEPNLIPDGTFASGSLGGWGAYGDTSLTTTTTTAAPGSTYSAEATGISNGAIDRNIMPFVTAGQRYMATGWVSVSNVTSGSEYVNWQLIENCGASDMYPILQNGPVNNGQWWQFAGIIDLTSCNPLDKLLLQAETASGTLYLDDVTLQVIP